MRIWLDDIREIPDDFDIWFKNGEDLVKYIDEGKQITFISFDHDLSFKHYYGGSPDKITGYDVAKHIEKLAYEHKIESFEWAVHSANPVGAKRIKWAMCKAEDYWNDMEYNAGRDS